VDKSDVKKDAVKSQQKTDGARASAREEEPETVTRQATPVLGVMIGKAMGVEGAEVIRVWPDSPAEKAGLKKGDLITKAGGKTVRSPEALRAVVTSHSPNDGLALTVRRNGEEKKFKAELGGADDFGTPWEPEVHRSFKPRAWLGIRMLPESGVGRGVTVEAVVPGSPADQAGLKPGDDILRINKTRVEAVADLQMQVAGYSPGETVHLVVKRNDGRKKIDVELGAFAGWHGDISELTEPQVRQLLEEFMQDAIASPKHRAAGKKSPKAKDESHKVQKDKVQKDKVKAGKQSEDKNE
jgi:predicted metalloprotease with PDZ domain